MKRLLIVSPHFPPVNAPDLHRVRMSLPFYADGGWEPHVLTVRADAQPMPRDNSLVETLPADVPVTSVGAWPIGMTRAVGLGSVALRAWTALERAGLALIRERRIDLVFFSTTAFFCMPLGRVWRARTGVPYVIDLQDPWWTDYYDDKPRDERPPKYALTQTAHRVLERWTMRRVSGVMTVSAGYTDTLRRRYPWMASVPSRTIPFGASRRDADVARAQPSAEPAGACGDGLYIGRAGADMATALTILFRALKSCAARDDRFRAMRLSFVGTDYATDGRARETVAPVAAAEGVGAQVTEQVGRVPYLDALGRLQQAGFLVILGSDDPQYSPSKVYPYILAKRPIVAVVHAASPIADVIRRTRTGLVITFGGRDDVDAPASALAAAWPALLDGGLHVPDTDWDAFAPFMAPALTAEQCALFDAALAAAS